MHPEFKIQEIFPERFANPINKQVHYTLSLFNVRFSSLEGNISSVLNPMCINLYITYHKNNFYLQTLLYSFEVFKQCFITSSTSIMRRDSNLNQIFLCYRRKYFLQGIINYNSNKKY